MRDRCFRRPILAVILLLALLACGACSRGEESAIRSRLAALAAEANKPPAEGLGLVAHATAMGGYFTDDVVVDLGPGTNPIQGREMLIGMLGRLQPRTSAYRVALEDLDVRVTEGGETAALAMTVRIVPRSATSGEATDAREFAATMSKADGTWRIARMTAVQTLR
ncbi:MAG: DUF4440 domain-containing protein [Acidobacteria bacterium]|nr:DUF4440 domain-containing protein [Acidobacteriota bacterium]